VVEDENRAPGPPHRICDLLDPLADLGVVVLGEARVGEKANPRVSLNVLLI